MPLNFDVAFYNWLKIFPLTVLDTDFVLHDVEDELKEQYLFQHSEKIAVAFGLISISKPKPIRVLKNLCLWRLSHCNQIYFNG